MPRQQHGSGQSVASAAAHKSSTAPVVPRTGPELSEGRHNDNMYAVVGVNLKANNTNIIFKPGAPPSHGFASSSKGGSAHRSIDRTCKCRAGVPGRAEG